jgi:hypothetical protein
MHLVVLNTEIHVINTRQSINLTRAIDKASQMQEWCLLYGYCNIYHLPCNLRELSNDLKKFKSAIKILLLNQSFYLINEYLEWSEERI